MAPKNKTTTQKIHIVLPKNKLTTPKKNTMLQKNKITTPKTNILPPVDVLLKLNKYVNFLDNKYLENSEFLSKELCYMFGRTKYKREFVLFYIDEIPVCYDLYNKLNMDNGGYIKLLNNNKIKFPQDWAHTRFKHKLKGFAAADSECAIDINLIWDFYYKYEWYLIGQEIKKKDK